MAFLAKAKEVVNKLGAQGVGFPIPNSYIDNIDPEDFQKYIDDEIMKIVGALIEKPNAFETILEANNIPTSHAAVIMLADLKRYSGLYIKYDGECGNDEIKRMLSDDVELTFNPSVIETHSILLKEFYPKEHAMFKVSEHNFERINLGEEIDPDFRGIIRLDMVILCTFNNGFQMHQTFIYVDNEVAIFFNPVVDKISNKEYVNFMSQYYPNRAIHTCYDYNKIGLQGIQSDLYYNTDIYCQTWCCMMAMVFYFNSNPETILPKIIKLKADSRLLMLLFGYYVFKDAHEFINKDEDIKKIIETKESLKFCQTDIAMKYPTVLNDKILDFYVRIMEHYYLYIMNNVFCLRGIAFISPPNMAKFCGFIKEYIARIPSSKKIERVKIKEFIDKTSIPRFIIKEIEEFFKEESCLLQ